MWVNGTLTRPSNPVAALAALSTEGGEVVRINGTNLGPAMPRSYVSAVWCVLGWVLALCPLLVWEGASCGAASDARACGSLLDLRAAIEAGTTTCVC